MLLAGQNIETEGSVGDGKFDARYTAPDGTVFLFELKYCSFKESTGKDMSKEKASVEMEQKAEEAMKQIEEKNYTRPSGGIGSTIYKVPLVIGGRTEVLAVFEKEEAN
jgi:hypothetical protein